MLFAVTPPAQPLQVADSVIADLARNLVVRVSSSFEKSGPGITLGVERCITSTLLAKSLFSVVDRLSLHLPSLWGQRYQAAIVGGARWNAAAATGQHAA